jgi:hypothetical protein
MLAKATKMISFGKKSDALGGGRRASPNTRALGLSVVVTYMRRAVTLRSDTSLFPATQSFIATYITQIAAAAFNTRAVSGQRAISSPPSHVRGKIIVR